MSRRLFAAVLVVAGALGLAACGSVGGSGDSDVYPIGFTPTDPATAGSTRPAPQSSRPSRFAALEARLISHVPRGFIRQPDSVGDTGPSDLAKAIRDDGTPDARTRLTRDRFVRGYQRLWMNSSHDQVIAFLYQFATPTGASDYFRYSVQQFQTATLKTTQGATVRTRRFAVPGLPASHSTGLAAEADHRAVDAAVAVKGPMLMMVVCGAGGPAAAGIKARLLPLARQQFDRL